MLSNVLPILMHIQFAYIIYIHTYIQTHVRTYVHTYIHTNAQTNYKVDTV